MFDNLVQHLSHVNKKDAIYFTIGWLFVGFPDRLKNVIEKSGLKREQFADRTGVSRRQLFNYLGDKSEPTLAFLQKVKQEFRWVDVEWLITGRATFCTDDNGQAPSVAEDPPRILTQTIVDTVRILQTLGEHDQKETLKYVKERKALEGINLFE